MDRERAKEILGNAIEFDLSLHDLYCYLDWKVGDSDITLDGVFNIEELEAIAWWMRNTKKEGEENGQKTT